MSKSKVSKQFSRFAKQTTKGAFDEARKAERTARGIPFEVGTKGTGVITLDCDEMELDGEDYPYIQGLITVVTPEGGKGKNLQTTRWIMRDSPNPSKEWTAEDAWGAALGDLEKFGCPEEITKGYEDFSEVIDWFDAEPRMVSWIVEPNNYTKRDGTKVEGKQISAYQFIEKPISQESADDGDKPQFPEGTEFCTYKGVRWAVLSKKGNDLEIQNTNNSRVKTVELEDVEMEA